MEKSRWLCNNCGNRNCPRICIYANWNVTLVEIIYRRNHHDASQLLVVVAVICTLISVITEFTKEIGILNRIPTSLQVLILSIIICVTAFFAYISYAKITFVWYYLVAVIFASFIVAIVCCKGWEYLITIWKRFYKPEDK